MDAGKTLRIAAGLMLAWAGAASAELAMSWGVAAAPRAVGGDTFCASDNARNPGYAPQTDWIGLNGGEGFKPWKAEGSLPGATRMVATDGGFQFKAGEPAWEMAMIRGLDTTAGLDSGTFSVTMWGAMGGADEPGDFAGFAVYRAGGRIGDAVRQCHRDGARARSRARGSRTGLAGPVGGGAGGAAGAEGGTAWAKRIGRKGTWHLSFRGEVVR